MCLEKSSESCDTISETLDLGNLGPMIPILQKALSENKPEEIEEVIFRLNENMIQMMANYVPNGIVSERDRETVDRVNRIAIEAIIARIKDGEINEDDKASIQAWSNVSVEVILEFAKAGNLESFFDRKSREKKVFN